MILATARAVADLRVLAEYCLPFVKVGGVFAALKGPDGPAEVEAAKKAISLLGGKVEAVKSFTLPGQQARTVAVIRKVQPTPAKYPRHGGEDRKAATLSLWLKVAGGLLCKPTPAGGIPLRSNVVGN